MPLPEALERAEFEQRKPAMGLTKALLLELREHVQNKGLTPKEHRFLFKRIRSEMLRQLIPCSDISTTLDLISILENEIDIGVPSPVPKWYKVRIFTAIIMYLIVLIHSPSIVVIIFFTL